MEKEKEFNINIQKYESEISNRKKEIIETESKLNSNLKEQEKVIKEKDNEITKLVKEKENLSKETGDNKEYIQKLLADIKCLEQKIQELKDLLAACQDNNKALIEVSFIFI